jgi:hypothetical protein
MPGEKFSRTGARNEAKSVDTVLENVVALEDSTVSVNLDARIESTVEASPAELIVEAPVEECPLLPTIASPQEHPQISYKRLLLADIATRAEAAVERISIILERFEISALPIGRPVDKRVTKENVAGVTVESIEECRGIVDH